MSKQSLLVTAIWLLLTILLALPADATVTVRMAGMEKSRVGERIVVPAGESREQDIHTVWGSVKIDGELDGDVEVVWGTLEVNGTVDGDVTLVGGTFKLTGTIDGDVEAVGTEVHFGDGANIEGRFTGVMGSEQGRDVVRIRDYQSVRRPRVSAGFPQAGWHLGFGFLGLIILVLVTGLAPSNVERMAAFLDMPGRWVAAPFVGIAAMLAVCLVSLALCATFIGVLLVPFLFLAAWIAGYAGVAALYLLVGRKLIGAVRPGGAKSLLAPVLLAYFLLRIPALLPVIGVLVILLGVALFFFGVGLAVMTACGRAGGWDSVASVRVATIRTKSRRKRDQPRPPLAEEDPGSAEDEDREDADYDSDDDLEDDDDEREEDD